MSEQLYAELADWWSLLSPPGVYSEEAGVFLALLEQAAGGRVSHFMELGSGGGHLAADFPADRQRILVDISPQMLQVSKVHNPASEHVLADMRNLRLGRTVDAVLLHDAVMYMTTREDLRRALKTAWEHLAPGGSFLLVPDYVEETFSEHCISGGNEDADRAIQVVEWHWRPDPSVENYVVEFVYLLRENGQVRSVHEQHRMGLFSVEVWMTLIQEVGFELLQPDPDLLLHWEGGALFLARRPAAPVLRDV